MFKDLGQGLELSGKPVCSLVRGIQCKDLIERVLEGDKADLNQIVPGTGKDLILHMKTFAEGLIGVIAQALGIGHGHQKQVKGCGLVSAPVNMVVTDQAMIQPAEVFWDFTQSSGTYQMLFYHKGLLLCVGD
jgi:hypothetical protein